MYSSQEVPINDINKELRGSDNGLNNYSTQDITTHLTTKDLELKSRGRKRKFFCKRSSQGRFQATEDPN